MRPFARTSLTAFAPSMRDPDPQGARIAARELWKRHGIVVIMPGDCTGLDRDLVEAVANRLHGRRG